MGNWLQETFLPVHTISGFARPYSDVPGLATHGPWLRSWDPPSYLRAPVSIVMFGWLSRP